MPRQFANIPGFDVRVRDGQIVAPRSTPPTGLITLIDYALWGPVNEVRTVDNFDDGRALYGKATGAFGDDSYTAGFNGNGLVRGLEQAINAGARNLGLVRADFGGEAASTTIFYDVDSDTPSAAEVTDAGGILLTFATLPTAAVGNAGYYPTTAASYVTVLGVTNAEILYTAQDEGPAGNDITITYVDPGLADQTLACTVDGTDITVSLATGAAPGMAITSTATLVMGIIASTPAAVALVAATKPVGQTNSTGIVTAMTVKSLAGGCNSSPVYTIEEIDTANDTITVSNGTVLTELPTGANTSEWSFSAGLTIAAAYPGAVGNSITYKFEDTTTGGVDSIKLSIQAPNELGGQLTRFTSQRYPTLSEFCHAINVTLTNLVQITASYGSLGTELTAALPIPAATFKAIGVSAGLSVDVDVTVGTNCADDEVLEVPKNPFATGITKAQKRKWFAAALGSCVEHPEMEDSTLPLLRGYATGIVVLPSLYADDLLDTDGGYASTAVNVYANEAWTEESYTSAADNILQWLLDFVHLQNNDGLIGDLVIGFSPLTNVSPASIRDRVTFLQSVEFMEGTLANTDGNTDTVDAGMYLSVFGGPQRVVVSKELGYYLASGAIQYAALLSNTHPRDSVSQMVLPGGTLPSYDFKPAQINALVGPQGATETGAKYVICDGRTKPDIVCISVTGANAASDFSSMHARQVCEASIIAVRAAVSQYIGKPFGFTQRSAMDNDITTAMENLYDQGVLFGGKGVGYKYQIVQTDTDSVLHRAAIFLSVKENPELDWIGITVQMFV